MLLVCFFVFFSKKINIDISDESQKKKNRKTKTSFVFMLRFYGPVNPMRSCRAPRVSLPNHTFTGQATKTSSAAFVIGALRVNNESIKSKRCLFFICLIFDALYFFKKKTEHVTQKKCCLASFRENTTVRQFSAVLTILIL